MKKQFLVIVLLLASVLCSSACNKHKIPAADSVLIHAKIYTVSSKEPWAQAMAIRAKIAPNQIGNTKVLMTIVGGKTVYQDSSWENK